MSRSQSPGRRRSAAKTTKTASKRRKSADAGDQRHVCSEPGCGRSYKTQRNLDRHTADKHPPGVEPESATQAVERWLATLTLTPATAVLAATIRELATALEKCEPTDKAKTSKELGAKWAELVTATGGDTPTGGDWTEGDVDDV